MDKYIYIRRHQIWFRHKDSRGPHLPYQVKQAMEFNCFKIAVNTIQEGKVAEKTSEKSNLSSKGLATSRSERAGGELHE